MPPLQTNRHPAAAWLGIRRHLLRETYRPNPVRHVMITKSVCAMQNPGFSTVTDRLMQQALLHQLLDPMFSPHSFGFRPVRPEMVVAAQTSGLPSQCIIFFQRFCSSGAQEIHGGDPHLQYL